MDRLRVEGLDRYSLGIPAAFLLLFTLDALGIIPIVYNGQVTLLLFIALIVILLRIQSTESFISRFIILLQVKFSSVRPHLVHWVITAVGAILALYLYSPGRQRAISAYKGLDTIFIAVGGMLGTILALGFSLSIITIQRAVDSFTTSIARLYRNDLTTHLVFIILAVFCLGSFIFAIEGSVPGIANSQLLPLEIFMIALSIDLIRLHYRRVGQLLEPSEAIKRLLSEVKTYIKERQDLIHRRASIQWRNLAGDQRRIYSINTLERSQYAAARDFAPILNDRSGELAEIALRAVAKGETYSAQLAISALADMACFYIDTRKGNLAITPTTEYKVFDSDLSSVLDPVYEHLQDINRNAATNKAETSCIHVVRALAQVAIHTWNLHANEPRNRAAAVVWKPLGYLGNSVREAQANNLIEVAFQANRVLLDIAKRSPDNSQDFYIYSDIIRIWQDICVTNLRASQGILANEVLKNLMALYHHLLTKRGFDLRLLLKTMLLEFLYSITPLTIANEERFRGPFAPYDLSNRESLGHFVANAVSTIPQDESEWINPFSDFMELNEAVSQHFRSLADDYDLGQSKLFGHIAQTTKYICHVYLNVLKKTTENPRHYEQLVAQVPWYLSFFWAAFTRASSINTQDAYEAGNTLASVAMQFYEAGYPKVTIAAADALGSIVRSCSLKPPKNLYEVGVLSFELWLIRVLAKARGDQDLVAILDRKLVEVKTLPDAEWAIVSASFEKRKRDLERDFWKQDSFIFDDRATEILKKLLNYHFPIEARSA
jgi:hypothetical protein